MAKGKLYIVLFTTAVCGVFSVIVSVSAVMLKPLQDANRKLDQQRNVLMVAGIIDADTALTAEIADELFRDNVVAKLIVLETGEVVPDEDPLAYDQQRALSDPSESVRAPSNPAGIQRLPNKAVVYLIQRDGETAAVVLPVEGKGLWSTLYGYLALEADLATIKGITFYAHAETPGLGGEIDNDRWRAQWPGKRLFDDAGRVVFSVAKGSAGDSPHAVDGLAGATLTANGVTHLVQFWLGEHGFGPYLANLKTEMGGR